MEIRLPTLEVWGRKISHVEYDSQKSFFFMQEGGND